MATGYRSRRIAASMRAPRPVETPDTDAATVFEQRWRRVDGMAARGFNVLALDAVQAEQLGRLRLAGKYRQDPDEWELSTSRPWQRMTSAIFAVLMTETAEERQLREGAFFDRTEATS